MRRLQGAQVEMVGAGVRQQLIQSYLHTTFCGLSSDVMSISPFTNIPSSSAHPSGSGICSEDSAILQRFVFFGLEDLGLRV